MSLIVPVILGSVRADRIGIGAARFLVSRLEARGHSAPLVDPAALKLPLLDRMYKEYPQGQAPAALEGLVHALPQRGRVRGGLGRVQSRAAAGAVQPARPLFGGVFLAALGDLLLLGRAVRRGARSDAAPRDARSRWACRASPRFCRSHGCTRPSTRRVVPQRTWLDKAAARFLDELEWYAEALRDRRRTGTPY